jgi:hypothetical protein
MQTFVEFFNLNEYESKSALIANLIQARSALDQACWAKASFYVTIVGNALTLLALVFGYSALKQARAQTAMLSLEQRRAQIDVYTKASTALYALSDLIIAQMNGMISFVQPAWSLVEGDLAKAPAMGQGTGPDDYILEIGIGDLRHFAKSLHGWAAGEEPATYRAIAALDSRVQAALVQIPRGQTRVLWNTLKQSLLDTARCAGGDESPRYATDEEKEAVRKRLAIARDCYVAYQAFADHLRILKPKVEARLFELDGLE